MIFVIGMLFVFNQEAIGSYLNLNQSININMRIGDCLLTKKFFFKEIFISKVLLYDLANNSNVK